MEGKNRKRIIQAAGEMFNQRGYRSVTLDDIANSLGMSKKTIYSYFSGKEEMAECVIKEHSEQVQEKVRLIREGDLDPIEKINEIISTVKEMRKKLNPQLLMDIQKYVPDLWDKLERQREERTLLMEVLIKEGQEKGVIKDINPKLAVILYLGVINYAVRPDMMMKYGFSVEEVFEALREVLMNGIRVR